MFSEIIFFVAVALLIILLARRFRAGGWRGTTGAAGGFFQKLWGTIIAPLEALMRGRHAEPRVGSVPIQASPHHQFWQEEAMDEKPELSSHFEEADRLLKEKNYAAAEKLFIKAAAANPKDGKTYAKLGFIYLQQKNYSDAIESLKVAVKLEPYNPSRHYNLALSYAGNKDIKHAISAVREAITLDPVTPKYRQLLEQLLNG